MPATKPLSYVDNDALSNFMKKINRELAFLYAEEGGIPGEIFNMINYGEDGDVRRLAAFLKNQLDAMAPTSDPPREVKDPDLEPFP